MIRSSEIFIFFFFLREKVKNSFLWWKKYNWSYKLIYQITNLRNIYRRTYDIWKKNDFDKLLWKLCFAQRPILDCLKPPWNLVFSIQSKKLGKESVSNVHNLPTILNARWKRDIYRDVHVRHARRQNRGVLERFLAWRSLRTVKRVQQTRVQLAFLPAAVL